MDSKKQREQLKREYKKHYRQMREVKEKLRRSKKKRNITEALNNMDTGELMASFDSFLLDVKSTVAHAEAKLDVALESLETKDFSSPGKQHDNISTEQKAKETLRQLKNEMGLLYSEIEQKAESLQIEKTIGPEANETKKDSKLNEG
ncbi:MAG TPA: hypothetical protein VK106_04090 [Balneolaceae bacterium]|nr:hypothetical protein [Balneolaceae bacterium]